MKGGLLSGKGRALFAPMFIILISAAVYANTAKGGFVWDDRGTIIANKSLRSIESIPSFYLSDQWKPTGNPAAPYYRPVINTLWLMEFQLWGENPAGYHLTNIFLHALLSFLFYRLCKKILKSETAAFWAAAIFAVHPIHSENVAWITGVGYLACALFIVSSLLFYVQFRERGSVSALSLSVFLYACAVFSIEYALMFPFILLAYEHLAQGRRIAAKHLLPFVLVPVFYIVARELIGVLHPVTDVSLYRRVLTAAVILAGYLQAFFAPYTLKVFYDIRPVTTLYSREVIAGLVAAALILLTGYLYKREKRAFFGLAWFIFFLFPAANIVAVIKPQMIALRYLYIPSMGLAMFSGVYFEKFFRRRAVLPILVVALLSLKTVTQNGYWQSEIVLYEKMVQDAPNAALVRNNLGVAYLEAGAKQKAVREFRRAVELDSRNGFALFNLGNTYQELNDIDSAVPYLRRAIALNPSDSRSYNALGVAYKKAGRFGEALAAFTGALAYKPDNYEAHYNMANLLYAEGQRDAAMVHYREFLRLAPPKYRELKQSVQNRMEDRDVLKWSPVRKKP